MAIKGDSNQANEMITNLYKINSSSSLSRTSPMINTSASSPSLLSGATSSQVPTTSRLFDQTNKSASTSVALIKKEVRFELGSNVDSEPRKRKNDTESSSSISTSSNPKSSRSDTSLQNGPKSDTKSKKTSSSRSCKLSLKIS